MFAPVGQSHRHIEKLMSSPTAAARLRLMMWRAYHRIASMAGPLATKYAIRYDRPRFVRTEVQRQAMAVQGDRRVPPLAPPSVMPKAKGKAAAGFRAAAGGLLDYLGFKLVPSGGSGAMRPVFGAEDPKRRKRFDECDPTL